MREIQLIGGGKAIVDDIDHIKFGQLPWRVLKAPYGRNYAMGIREIKGQYLHRLILGISDTHIDVDHKDGDGLNCQRDNLRACSRSLNSANSRKRRAKCSSRYKGVSWFKPAELWRAYIGTKKNRTWLGYFKDEIVAARAYDTAARSRFGEFARTNFE